MKTVNKILCLIGIFCAPLQANAEPDMETQITMNHTVVLQISDYQETKRKTDGNYSVRATAKVITMDQSGDIFADIAGATGEMSGHSIKQKAGAFCNVEGIYPPNTWHSVEGCDFKVWVGPWFGWEQLWIMDNKTNARNGVNLK